MRYWSSKGQQSDEIKYCAMRKDPSEKMDVILGKM